MSDNAETVALGLLQMLMQHDQLAAEFKEKPAGAARNMLLNAYGECLRAVIVGRERAEGRTAKPRMRGPRNVEAGEGPARVRRGPPAASETED